MNNVVLRCCPYQRKWQLGSVCQHAEQIADLYQQGNDDDDDDDGVNGNPAEADASFTKHIGSLSDVHMAMEEAALCIQHAESYLHFIQHTCNEVNWATGTYVTKKHINSMLPIVRQKNNPHYHLHNSNQ